MRNERGITLTTLVITVIVILIVSTSMIYSGVNTYKSMMKQNYLAEMQLIQAEVNKFVDAYSEKANNLGLDPSNFKAIYVNIYENDDGFCKLDMEAKSTYLAFHDFINSYNSIEDKSLLQMDEIKVSGEFDATGAQLAIKSIPILTSEKAGKLMEESGVELAEKDSYLKNIWEEVLATDGNEFLTILATDTTDQKNDKIKQSQANYFYFSSEMASQFLNMEVSTDLAINFDERYVVSLSKYVEQESDSGAVYEYHTEYFMIGGEKVIEYEPEFLDESKISLDFSYNIEFEETNKRFKVIITPSKDNTYGLKNLYYYSGYTDADQSITVGITGNEYPEVGKNGLPVLVPKKSWNLIDGNTFYTAESGAFGVKIVDTQNNEAFRVIKVSYVNKPNTSGLVPILKEDSNWRIVGENESWYNYANGQWANAMIEDDSKISSNGKTISKLGSTFVWIPRFAYRIIYFKSEEAKEKYLQNNDITQIAAYSNSSLGENSNELVRVNGNKYDYATFLTDKVAQHYIVEVKFLMGTTNNDSTGTDVTTAYGGFFKVHPAFSKQSWGEEISGFWASKYSIGIERVDATDICMSRDGSKETDNFVDAFVNTYMMKSNMKMQNDDYDVSNIDTHLMKNIEYGAIVLLTAALQAEDLEIDNSNTKTEYGLYDLFDKNKTMVSAVSTDAFNELKYRIENKLQSLRYTGRITQKDIQKLQSSTSKYFDIYSKNTGNPEQKSGDGIYELTYKDSAYSVQYSTLGSVVIDGDEDRYFYMIRGNDLTVGAQRFLSVKYVTGREKIAGNGATECYWRAVLVND